VQRRSDQERQEGKRKRKLEVKANTLDVMGFGYSFSYRKGPSLSGLRRESIPVVCPAHPIFVTISVCPSPLGRKGRAPACAPARRRLVSPTSGPSHRSVSSVLLLRLSNGDSELLFFPLWVADFQSGVEEALPPLLGSQASRAAAAATPTAAHALLLLLLPALHQEIRRKDANGLGSRR